MHRHLSLTALVLAGLTACQPQPQQPVPSSSPVAAQQASGTPQTVQHQVRLKPFTLESDDENGKRVKRTGLQVVFSVSPDAPQEALRAEAESLFDQALREKTEEVNGNIAAVIFITGQSVVDGQQRQSFRPFFFLHDDGAWRLVAPPAAKP